jgi:hypothetical protein
MKISAYQPYHEATTLIHTHNDTSSMRSHNPPLQCDLCEPLSEQMHRLRSESVSREATKPNPASDMTNLDLTHRPQPFFLHPHLQVEPSREIVAKAPFLAACY